MSSVEVGCRVLHHTCGFQEQVFEGSGEVSELLAKAQWLSSHCDCPPITREEETALRLHEGYGITIKFTSNREAKAFREGILSVINEYVVSRISRMNDTEAYQYIMQFWGGGSYENLLVARRRQGQ